MKLFTNKKGNAIVDVLVIVVFLFILGISYVSINVLEDALYDPLKAEFEDKNTQGANQSKEYLDTTHEVYPSLFDGIIAFAFIGLWMASLLAAFLLDTNPVFFVITVILLVIIVIIGVILGNSYEEFMDDDTITTFQSGFPISYWILTHMLPVTIILGFSISLVLYARLRAG